MSDDLAPDVAADSYSPIWDLQTTQQIQDRITELENWRTPVTLARFNLGSDDGRGAHLTDGFGSQIGRSAALVDIPTQLPARAGYTRQYRLAGWFLHLSAPGETLYRVQLWDDWSFYNSGPLTVNELRAAGVVEVVGASPWVESAFYDSVAPLPIGVHLWGSADWAGAIGQAYVYAAVLEGRYIN